MVTPTEILRLRLAQQRILHPPLVRPEDLVGWMGAIQAQDYSAAKWAIGLRLKEGRESDVDQAITGQKIVRSWLFRGTLHFAAAEDYHWMRELVAERLITGTARRRDDLGIDDRTLAKARRIFAKAMKESRTVRRDELMAALERMGIRPDNQRGYHLLWRCAMEGLICFAGHQGKQPAFALVEDWLPKAKAQSRERSLAKLAERYFKSRGPATVKDFIWWSGLKTSEAKTGLEEVQGKLRKEVCQGDVYWMEAETPSLKQRTLPRFLLPGFDEYLLSYHDRGVTLAPGHFQKIVPGNNGMFLPMMVQQGKIVGTWKKEILSKEIRLRFFLFSVKMKKNDEVWLRTARAYGEFLEMPLKLKETGGQ